MFSRGRLAIFVFVVALLVIGGLALLGSAPSSCGYPAPIPSLPPVLASQGGFDQAFDPTDTQTINDVAVRAATALNTDLIGVAAGQTLFVHSAATTKPDAYVVVLQRTATSTAGAGRVAGVVVFLRDCSGRVYYSSVTDFGGAGLAGFPRVSQEQAQAELGGKAELIYRDSPAQPLWRLVGGAASTPAT